MTLTAILWLQSGRRFEELALPDGGYSPAQLVRQVLKARPSMWGRADYLPRDTLVETETFVFELTDPTWAAISYKAGRRRFHYRETSGWRPREELEGSLCRDRDARFERIVSTLDQHRALMDAGAFPVHTCALPAGLADGDRCRADLRGAGHVVDDLPAGAVGVTPSEAGARVIGAPVDLEQPTFWTVEGPTFVFRVTEETARRIDHELTAGIVEFVRFEDIGGSATVYRREKIFGLWRSSPESREMDRALNKALNAEMPPGTDGC